MHQLTPNAPPLTDIPSAPISYSSFSCNHNLVLASVTAFCVAHSEAEAVVREGVLGGAGAGEVDSTSNPSEHPLDPLPHHIRNRLIHYGEGNGHWVPHADWFVAHSIWGGYYWSNCRRQKGYVNWVYYSVQYILLCQWGYASWYLSCTISLTTQLEKSGDWRKRTTSRRLNFGLFLTWSFQPCEQP